MKKTIFYLGLVLVLSGFFISTKTALADDISVDGHLWVFNFIVPANESTLDVKFADWLDVGGIRPGSNIQFYSPQSLNAPNQDNVVIINNATEYIGKLNLVSKRDGDNVQVIVQAFNFSSNSRTGGVSPEVQFIDASGKSIIVEASNNNVPNLAPLVDTTAPVITLLGDSTVNLTVGDTYTDAGVTASDDVDGNISVKVVTINPVDINTAGTYIIAYDVADTAGNKATEVIRTVIVAAIAPVAPPQPVADVTAPVITLLGDSTVNLFVGDTYVDAGVTAIDDIDGDITLKSVTVNPVDSNTTGTYTITYNVMDAAGNKAIEVMRTVVVTVPTPEPTIDTTTPVVDLPSTSVSSSSTKDDVSSGQ